MHSENVEKNKAKKMAIEYGKIGLNIPKKNGGKWNIKNTALEIIVFSSRAECEYVNVIVSVHFGLVQFERR